MLHNANAIHEINRRVINLPKVKGLKSFPHGICSVAKRGVVDLLANTPAYEWKQISEVFRYSISELLCDNWKPSFRRSVLPFFGITYHHLCYFVCEYIWTTISWSLEVNKQRKPWQQLRHALYVFSRICGPILYYPRYIGMLRIKIIFDNEVQTGLNLPKIHFLIHLFLDVRDKGPADNFSLQAAERQHSNAAKNPYKRTNKTSRFLGQVFTFMSLTTD